MNIGSSRGSGGGGLAGHWLKAKNEEVRPLPARGIGARGDLRAQVRALTAETAHATFTQPVLHFWFPPNPADRKLTAEEKADLLARVEREFHLEHQPRIGCVHALRRDMEAAGKERHPSWDGADEHEHYAWSLVREDGRAVDHMKKSMIRQQRVVAEWQHAHGFRITPMKHVTPVLEYLDRHNPEAAAAVRAAGMRSLNDPDPSAANIAAYRSAERSQMERSPAVPVVGKTRHAFNVRKDVLGAWRASDDGRSFEAALSERGYRLAQGAKSALIVDPAGIRHRAAELLGTAGRKLEGKAIAAAEVHARLAGLDLAPVEQARRAMRDRKAAQAEPSPSTSAGHSLDPEIVRGCEWQRYARRVTASLEHRAERRAPKPQVAETRAFPAETLGFPQGGRLEQRRDPHVGSRQNTPAQPGAREPDPGRRDRDRARPEAATNAGPQGDASERVCGHVGGEGRPRSAGTQAAAGAAGRGGEGQARPSARPLGADRREPDRARAAHGRARVRDRRAERGLASAMRSVADGIADGEREARFRALSARLAPPSLPAPATVNHRGISLCPSLETEEERRVRRARWLAAAMRRAYDLRWVPPSVVVNLDRIDVDTRRQAVILTLRSGTKLVDRQDRIDVIGTADDVVVGELVAAVQRRGWDAVRLHGTEAFRRACAIQLQLLDPPVAVADSPLSEADQAEVEHLRHARAQQRQHGPGEHGASYNTSHPTSPPV